MGKEKRSSEMEQVDSVVGNMEEWRMDCSMKWIGMELSNEAVIMRMGR